MRVPRRHVLIVTASFVALVLLAAVLFPQWAATAEEPSLRTPSK